MADTNSTKWQQDGREKRPNYLAPAGMRDGLTGLPVEVDSGETGRTGQVEAPVGRDEVNTQDVATGSVEVKSGTTRDEDQTSNSEADAGPKENDDEHTMRQKHTKN